MDKFDRVHKINEWARNRYTKNGVLNIHIGGKKSRYQWIVDEAIDKYLLNK